MLFSSWAFFVTAQEKSTTQNNILLDSDQDGLTDAEEKLYGTNPHNPDTDGDGYSDGAEVKAGYNPLKPAPGDKLSTITNTTADAVTAPANSSTNLTQQLAQKISTMASSTDPNDQQASLDQIQQTVNDSLGSSEASFTLPQIDPTTIKKKVQNYSADQADKKKKEDFVTYISTILYIMASNSPVPITSSTDATSAFSQMAQKVISSVSTQDSSDLDSLSKSGQAMLEQIQEVEVPADLIDLHIKALQYATYAQNLKDLIKPNPSDPMYSLVNYSKIAAFVESLSSFATEAQAETDKYNVDYSDIQSKVKSMGADIPNLEDIIKLSTSELNLSTSDSSVSK